MALRMFQGIILKIRRLIKSSKNNAMNLVTGVQPLQAVAEC